MAGCGDKSEKKDNNDQNAESALLEESVQGIEQNLFENTYVKVLKVEINPGQQLPWHEGGPRVIYSLSDYTIRLKKNPEDTSTKESSFQKGDVHWHDQNRHTVENIGSDSSEFLVFMRKPATFPAQSDVSAEENVEEVVPSDTEVLLENEAVHVIRTTLEAGEKAPMHTGRKRLVYSLNAYTVRYDTQQGEGEEQTFARGDVHWHEKGEHSVENTGDEMAEFLIVEFKK